MRIEDQFISLDYAKRLKELNVKQNSMFYWYYSVYTEDNFKWKIMQHHRLNIKSKNKDKDVISAYSVAELGEMLRGVIRTPKMWLDTIDHQKNLKEADMRANILICAIENQVVTEEWRKQWLNKI